MKSQVQIAAEILAQVVERLTQAAGIDPGLLEAGRIGWTIEGRRRRLSLRDAQAYLEYLNSSAEELEHLIDALVIQETRFFRDPAVFEQIRTWAQSAVSAAAPEPLRILSAPCSTGQEAYSVAATLRVAGIPLSGFVIDAFDISRSALSAAQRGIYPSGALEHVPEELRSLCGALQDNHWHIHDELRNRIRFERRNLALPGALDDEPAYDLVLCRNLFIYLHSDARAVLAGSLSRALRPGGRLIIGTGDRVPELNRYFAPLKPASSFAFTHKAVVSSNQPTEIWRLPVPSSVRPRKEWTPQPEPERVPSTAAEFYRRALEYSDSGNPRQAERRCRQALYLDPSYVPALELLYVLWQMHPSARLRRALQARIRRIRSIEHDAIARQDEPLRATELA